MRTFALVAGPPAQPVLVAHTRICALPAKVCSLDWNKQIADRDIQHV